MKDILDKITSYNLFNYLLPGFVFIVFIIKTTNATFFDFGNNSLLILPFFAYFLGLVISRLGSSVIEPILKVLKYVRFEKHSDYVKVSEYDKKLDELSEENNSFRTYISLFSLVLLVSLFINIAEYFEVKIENPGLALSGVLLVVFLASYRKRTAYISSRIKSKLNKTT